MNHAFIPLASTRGRLVIAATVLGSGAVFVEMTVVNVALPSIARDLGIGMAGLQWILDGYLLTLSALILLGGTLGDIYGRDRLFVLGAVGFGITSGAVAIAPGIELLVILRLLQGVAGAMLVPNSLALLESVFAEQDRGRAVGKWAGWSGVSTAAGPLIGGALLEVASWRIIFAVVVPTALVAAWLAHRTLPDISPARHRSVDYSGAALATFGLAGIIIALISGPAAGFGTPWVLLCGIGGVALLIGFVFCEANVHDPLLPLSIFRSRIFYRANFCTLFIYAALGGLFFMLMLVLQNGLGYSPLLAGTSLLPINVLLLILSPISGGIATRIGPRWPMTIGAATAGIGMLLLTRVQPGAGYFTTVFPGVAVFGSGLGMLVAPLTAAVLGAAPDQLKGVAAAFNNAVARVAGLIAVALLPLAAGVAGLQNVAGPALVQGYARATTICAGLCFAAAAIALTLGSTPKQEQ